MKFWFDIFILLASHNELVKRKAMKKRGISMNTRIKKRDNARCSGRDARMGVLIADDVSSALRRVVEGAAVFWMEVFNDE